MNVPRRNLLPIVTLVAWSMFAPAASAAQTPAAPTPAATATATAAATTAAATSPSAFDGTWAVTLTCLVAADGALGYTYHFSARVRNGTLHGEHGTEQQASWLVIDGRIEPDGSSMLNAHGLTGSPQYAVGRVAPLTAYAYHVTAHFDAARGTGTRVELRPCTLLFEKS